MCRPHRLLEAPAQLIQSTGCAPACIPASSQAWLLESDRDTICAVKKGQMLHFQQVHIELSRTAGSVAVAAHPYASHPMKGD